jgi:signal transduction histidine kinase
MTTVTNSLSIPSGSSTPAVPEVGRALRERIADLARRCAEEFPARGAWEQHVQRLLADVSAALTTGGSPPAATAPPPGELGAVLAAYARLREAVVGEVGKGLRRALREEEARALHFVYDAAVARRASALAEAQSRELRVASDAHAKFMSYMSHDLRGSLNGVVLMLEVMRRELEGQEAFRESVEDIELMRKSIRDTVALMDRHLLSDRLRRRRVEPSFRAMDLRATVDSAIGKLAGRAAEKGINLVNEVPVGVGVHSDPEFVEIGLAELLDNAVRYGSAGDVRITGGADGAGWTLTVADAGPGFAAERLEQFMDPIKRMELRERGLGIGIARHAARLLGGELEARTEPGGSTVFALRAP